MTCWGTFALWKDLSLGLTAVSAMRFGQQGLNAWHRQLRGTAELDAAKKMLLAALKGPFPHRHRAFAVLPAGEGLARFAYFHLFLNVVMEGIPFLDRYENWFITHHFNSWLLVFGSPIPWSRIVQFEIILLTGSMTAFLIGAVAFHVRDIKP